MTDIETLPAARNGVLATTGPTPMTLIESAIARGIDPDQLGKLMDLQERWERNRAAERFGNALAQFQSRCPAVVKGRQGDRYKFASLDDVMAAAGPVLAECGIGVSFDTEQSPDGGKLTVLCHLRVGAHVETRRFTSPVPSLKVNETQQYGAALSYLRRYALCAALNIVGTDRDNDAAALMQCVDDTQLQRLRDLIVGKNVDLDRFLTWASQAAKFKVGDLEHLPRALYQVALGFLQRKDG